MVSGGGGGASEVGGGGGGASVVGGGGGGVSVATLGVGVLGALGVLADVREYTTPPTANSAISPAAPTAYFGNRRTTGSAAFAWIGPVGGMYSTRGRPAVRSLA